jgi:hypothetical protein
MSATRDRELPSVALPFDSGARDQSEPDFGRCAWCNSGRAGLVLHPSPLRYSAAAETDQPQLSKVHLL